MGDLPVAVIRRGAPLRGQMPGRSWGLHYVYADHLNTPRVIIRSVDNRIVWRWDQADPFGMSQPDENPDKLGVFTYNPRFPGQVFDRETNNHYNYVRDYDPQQGRYVQSDPIGLEGGINTYAYVGADPGNFVDPDGLVPLPVVTGLIGAGVGAVGNILGQIAVSKCKPFSWTELGVAVGGGFIAGAIAPFVPGE